MKTSRKQQYLFLTRERPGTGCAGAAALRGEQTEAITEAGTLVLDGGQVLVGAVLLPPAPARAVAVLLAGRAHAAAAVVEALLVQEADGAVRQLGAALTNEGRAVLVHAALVIIAAKHKYKCQFIMI